MTDRAQYNNSAVTGTDAPNMPVDIEYVMDRYGLNLSAARVLKVVGQLVYASRLRGVKDGRGVPYCYASKEWIAGKIGKSARTIARAIADLKAAGLIEVKRTRANALIFITGYEVYQAPAPEDVPSPSPETDTDVTSCAAAEGALCASDGTSGTATNGTSKYYHLSINNNKHNPSIVLNPRAGRKDGTDCSSCPDDGRLQAERARLYREMRWKLYEHEDFEGRYGPTLDMIATYVADAVARKQAIRVNDGIVDSGTYWHVVSRLSPQADLMSMLEEIKARDTFGLIRNRRAYLLASLYNCVMWQGMDEIRPSRWTEDRIEARISNG